MKTTFGLEYTSMCRIQKRYRMTEIEFSGEEFSRVHTEHITTGYVLLGATRASIGRFNIESFKNPSTCEMFISAWLEL